MFPLWLEGFAWFWNDGFVWFWDKGLENNGLLLNNWLVGWFWFWFCAWFKFNMFWLEGGANVLKIDFDGGGFVLVLVCWFCGFWKVGGLNANN